MRKTSILVIIAVLAVLLASCSQVDETGDIPSTTPPTSSFSAGETEETTLPSEEPTVMPESEPPQLTESEQSTATPAKDSTSTSTQKPQSKPSTDASQPVQSQAPAETSKPSTPSKPPATSTPTQPPATSEPKPVFDINYWIQFAKDYGKSIGLIYDEGTTGSWDTPIAAGSTLKYTERDIKGYLNGYVQSGVQYFSVWAEKRSDGKYDIYIGYA